jgi:hypothetical protein
MQMLSGLTGRPEKTACHPGSIGKDYRKKVSENKNRALWRFSRDPDKHSTFSLSN